MADNKLLPGHPYLGTASQWNGIDYSNNGGILPDKTKSIQQSYQEMLRNTRIWSDTLMTFIQQERTSGYRQVFGQYNIPQNQGTLAVTFVGFQGGLADPNDFKLPIGQYSTEQNEQTFSPRSVTITTGLWGAYMKFQKHHLAISQYDYKQIGQQMLVKQCIQVLDNVAAVALFEGGGVFITGAYAPKDPNGQTVTLLTQFIKDYNQYGPLSWDLLDTAWERFRNFTIKLPKINTKADGSTEIIEVAQQIPIKTQADGNYTCLITEEGIRQLTNDPKMNDMFIRNGLYQDQIFNQKFITTGSTYRGFRFVKIDNPVTVECKTVAEAFPGVTGANANTIIPRLNFNGTGALHFATIIGGESTQSVCMETNFLSGGVNWSEIPFGSKIGDFYGLMNVVGWDVFYGAATLDTSKIINIVFNPKASSVVKAGTFQDLPNNLHRPIYGTTYVTPTDVTPNANLQPGLAQGGKESKGRK